jgi:hypothetical protein
MLLVFEIHANPGERASINASGRGGWRITETRGLGEREFAVETGRVAVDGEVFEAKNGRLIWVSLDGKITQHAFETDAQNSAGMHEAIETFLASKR